MLENIQLATEVIVKSGLAVLTLAATVYILVTTVNVMLFSIKSLIRITK